MQRLEDQFQARFEVAPEIRITAPGRVNLIGEHIDYLEGWVMPAAIDLAITFLVAQGSDSGEIEIWTPEAMGWDHSLPTGTFIRRTAAEENWMNYMTGVLAGYAEMDIAPRACRVAIFSTLPLGAGLSSSAALETATGLLVESLSGTELPILERAVLCQKAEHEWVGVPCGIMDQLSVGGGVEGHALKIDCRDLTIETIPLPEDTCLVVADSRVKHALADGEYRKRREECEAALAIIGESSWRDVTMEVVTRKVEPLGDTLFRRARHAVTEMQRVADFVDALKQERFEEIGKLMRDGHLSLRDDYEVSCAELDTLVDAAYEFGSERGQVGSRMTGGGFGGSTIHLVRRDAVADFIDHLRLSYREKCDLDPNCFVARASNGARVEWLTPSTSIVSPC